LVEDKFSTELIARLKVIEDSVREIRQELARRVRERLGNKLIKNRKK
jgi:hypothetical protein